MDFEVKYNSVMTVEEYIDIANRQEVFDSPEVLAFMREQSSETRKILYRLNNSYHTPEEVRELFSQITGNAVDETFCLFPPFYTDFGKNITVGKNVFINACCHFQDHGGVTIGDNCQIGHAVVFATLNHVFSPSQRTRTYPKPIVLKEGVWIGSNATILQGVTIGKNAIVGAGSTVTKDVPDNAIVGGVPAKVIRYLTEEELNG